MASEKKFSDGEIKKMIADNRKVVILFGAVYDLSKYIAIHPGGKKVINSNLGKDAT